MIFPLTILYGRSRSQSGHTRFGIQCDMIELSDTQYDTIFNATPSRIGMSARFDAKGHTIMLVDVCQNGHGLLHVAFRTTFHHGPGGSTILIPNFRRCFEMFVMVVLPQDTAVQLGIQLIQQMCNRIFIRMHAV
jgi:hypothetical protein